VIGLLQRVHEAWVRVGGAEVARIGPGLLVLVGIEQGDTRDEATRLARRVAGYRVFPDDAGRMNRSVLDTGGGVLLVPQFTLAADTGSGSRPGFEPAAAPALAEPLFNQLGQSLGAAGISPQCGLFGAEMDVGLVNHGPVTFWLRVAPKP
jgi:D-tyrosyl-tRNA(Tyr) deacylase